MFLISIAAINHQLLAQSILSHQLLLLALFKSRFIVP